MKPLKVQMFGRFSVSIGDRLGLLEGKRSSKALNLMQYMLMNRHKSVSRDTLIDILYSGEEVENPLNAIKIAAYRLRTLLTEEDFPDQDYILYKNGLYTWNSDIPCEVDAEIFEGILQAAARPGRSTEEKIALYKDAAELYKGDFLPKSAMIDWSIVLSAHYQSMYLDCICTLNELLGAMPDYQALQPILERARRLLPFEEEVQFMYISCLLEQKHFTQAIEIFNSVTEMFFNELGVGLSDEMKTLYQRISEDSQNNISELPKIINEIKEPVAKKGAYYCNFLTFIEYYRIFSRVNDRNGISAFLMNIIMTEANGKPLKTIENISNALECSIEKSLRRGDVYTRNNPNQFLILLPDLSQEHCSIVFARIRKAFRECFDGRGVRIHYKIAPVEYLEQSDLPLKFSPPQAR